jgi:hypothetical protein
LNDWDAAFDVTVQAPMAVKHAARITPLRMIDIFIARLLRLVAKHGGAM